MLRVSDPAPDFQGLDQFGRNISMGRLLANGPLVLFFYPKDFTFLCTRQVCAFRDEHEELTYAGAMICGISVDDAARHGEFSDRHNVPFPLLSDPTGLIVDAYGARAPVGKRAKRVTYVIDQRARVASVHHHEFSVQRHLEGMRTTLHHLLAEQELYTPQ
ncbi:MAG: peroxiredoxin [Myxococcota bacterium]